MSINYILYYLNKTKKMMHQYVEVLLKEEGIEDLVSSYCDVLTALYLNGGQLKMHEISDLVGKDKSTVTVLVNRLIERGYILKEKSQLDKRVTYIKLTEHASKHDYVFKNISEEIRNVAYTGFSEEEKTVFNSYLDRMQDNFIEILKK